MADTRSGYLAVYSADRSDIYGEFADATWETEDADPGVNHVFSGTASEGTMETFRRLNSEGISHVAYRFDADGQSFSGEAQLLRPEDNRTPGDATIRVETQKTPVVGG